MYVCDLVFVCVCVCICESVCMYVCMYVCMCVCICVVRVYVSECTHWECTSACVCVCMYVCVRGCGCVVCACVATTQLYTYLCLSYIYTYTYHLCLFNYNYMCLDEKDVKGASRNNITSERLFSVTDYMQKTVANCGTSVLGGVATAKSNGMFPTAHSKRAREKESPGSEHEWGSELFHHAVAMMMETNTRKFDEEQDAWDLKVMQTAQSNKKKKDEADKIIKSLAKEVNSTGYRNLRRVKTTEELMGIVSTMASTRIQFFLKTQIMIYTDGYGMTDFHVAWTKDRVHRSNSELINQLCRIMDVISVQPNMLVAKPVFAEQSSVFGENCEELVEIYHNLVNTAVNTLQDLDSVYGVQLLVAWGDVQPTVWPEDLTPLQKKFKRGVVFKDDGEMFVCLGLVYHEDKCDYAMLYYCVDCDRKPVNITDSELYDFSYCKDSVSHSDTTPGINTWEALEFEAPN
jgi:hypothetical protein